MTRDETNRAIKAVYRIERARLIAGLTKMVRDVDLAEELAQDALVIALSEWPKSGVPTRPGAWLMTAAKRRAIDMIRHGKMRGRKHEEIAREQAGKIKVVKLNVDENMNVPGKFSIRGIPTLLVFKGGQVAEQIVGAQPKENIVKVIERHTS